jgi:hypothetical protein
MSDFFLRLIPERPEFEPSSGAAEAAVHRLRFLLPKAESIQFRRFQKIVFVDQGGIFQRVMCPLCKADVTDRWQPWMDAGSQSGFEERKVDLPCCGQISDLNDLVYEWPAGFARFLIEVMNPNIERWLAGGAQEEIETLLGCKFRQILAHY